MLSVDALSAPPVPQAAALAASAASPPLYHQPAQVPPCCDCHLPAGNDSGGECGVQISRRFGMPDVAEPAYWSRNLTASSAAALAAQAGTGSSSSSGSSNGGRPRNPTLGPDAGAFLERVRQEAAAQQQAQQLGGSRRSALEQQQEAAHLAAAADGSGAAVQGVTGAAHPNPPFWCAAAALAAVHVRRPVCVHIWQAALCMNCTSDT